MEELVSLLERESDLVEDLHYRVLTLHKIIEGGETRHVERAANEVGTCLELVRDAEQKRTDAVNRIAQDHQLPADSSLVSLLEVAPKETLSRIMIQSKRLKSLTMDIEVAGNRASLAADRSLRDIEEIGALRLDIEEG